MEMKIIPANGGRPGMDGVFLNGYGDGDYTPRPRSGPLPSLHTKNNKQYIYSKPTDLTCNDSRMNEH